MLITVLVMAFAVSLEPFRIGTTALMLNRPRPLRQLLAFLSGGFAMGMGVGLVVLFVFRRRLPAAGAVTLSTVQILIGGLALLAAAVLSTGVLSRFAGNRAERLTTPARRLADGRSLWTAAAMGLGIALPSVDYLAVLAVILASGAAAVSQVGALVMFHLVAFGVVEVPLLAYLVAPERTRTAITATHTWIRSRRRVEVAALLAVVGVLLLTIGIVGR